MAKEMIGDLVAKLYSGKVDRREFLKRATAAGLSATLASQVVGRFESVSAQDAMPESTQIGNPNVAHTADTSKGAIKIYSSWPLTGALQKLGGDAAAAAQMCFDDFGNAAGGFAIEYEALDDGTAANEGKWEAGKETENANKALNDPDAMVYMGTYNSGAAKISIPLLNSANMAMISFGNTYQGLTKNIPGAVEEGEPDIYYPNGKRNYMRVCPADDIQGGAGARFAFNDLGKKKAYVLHDNSLYGKGVAKVFELEFTNLGGESLGFEGWEGAGGDYVTQMTRVADKGPEVVYLGGTVEQNGGLVMQSIRSVMPADVVTVIAADGMTNDAFIQGAAGAAEGTFLTFAGYTPDKLLEQGGPGADYVTRIKAIVGGMPDAYAVYSYEVSVAVVQAIETVGEKDRGKILDALFATEGFVSLLGFTWSFLETGDTDSSIIGLAQVVDGAIAYQKSIV